MPPAARHTEDLPLLRGDGRYSGDYAKLGVLHARFVRSTMAHARLGVVDLAQARAVPGVIAVFAAADLDSVLPAVPAPLDTLTNRDGSSAAAAPRPALARNRVRFAREAIALVVARTAAAAADGAEAVAVDYDPLPAVTTHAAVTNATDDSALHPDGNLAFDWQGGDAAATAQAFAAAHRSIFLPLPFQTLASPNTTVRPTPHSFSVGSKWFPPLS